MDDNKWCPGFKCLYQEARILGILNRSLSRGTLQVCPRWEPVRGDGGGIINAILLYCPGGGGGGMLFVIHYRGVMEGEGECKSFSRR